VDYSGVFTALANDFHGEGIMISFHNLTHRTYCEPDSTYQQLHNLTLGGEAVSVTNFELKRDVGIFHLHSETWCFVTPVQGKITEAVS
jgi:hypothetical protein